MRSQQFMIASLWDDRAYSFIPYIIASFYVGCLEMCNLLVYTCFPIFVQLATSVGRESKDIGMFGIHMNLGDYSSAQSAGAWFKVYAVYMVIGFLALMVTYSKTKERVLPAEDEPEVKYSDLFAELKRNKPLRILGLFFLCSYARFTDRFFSAL